MDKRTVKSLIIELKEENKSFQEISDILAREYGVKMSRQAVCGMYKRATSADVVNNNRNIMLATTDILNYSVLGMSESNIKETLNNRGVDVSLNKVKSILKDNSNYLDEIYNELLKRLSRLIEQGYDLEDIKTKLQFKGFKPTEPLLKSLIYGYITQEIQRASAKIVADVVNITDDMTILKAVNNRFNLGISIKDISKAMNN